MNYTTYEVKVYENGNKLWHNEHGPAFEYADGSKSYYLNGKLHRTDGPAIKWGGGYKAYYLNDKKYSYEDWKKEVEKLNKPEVKELTVSEISKLLGFEVKIVKE